jgi:tetratricopeptide (TPR) repeat protein
MQGRYLESIPWFEKAIAAAQNAAFDRGDRAIALTEIGLVRLELHDPRGAQAAFAGAEVLFARLQTGFTTPARADLLIGTGRAHLSLRQFATALPALQKADAFWREFAPDSRWAGEAALWLGRCLVALEREQEGGAELTRAAALLAASPLPADAQLAQLARQR